jgi:hypothetical protein
MTPRAKAPSDEELDRIWREALERGRHERGRITITVPAPRHRGDGAIRPMTPKPPEKHH